MKYFICALVLLSACDVLKEESWRDSFEHWEKHLAEKNEEEAKVSALDGREGLLSEQIGTSKQNMKEYIHKRKVYKKSIEFLTLVQESTKNRIQKGFEQIVTHALRSIYSSDYNKSFRKINIL